MLDVLEFLEVVGQDSRLRHASQGEMESALIGSRIDPEVRMAILAKSGSVLQALLGQAPLCCLINPANPDEKQEECDGSCEEGEDKKSERERKERRDED